MQGGAGQGGAGSQWSMPRVLRIGTDSARDRMSRQRQTKGNAQKRTATGERKQCSRGRVAVARRDLQDV